PSSLLDGPADPVVDHLDLDTFFEPEPDPGGAGPGVAGDVGEGLLDDPVGRLADHGRQRPGLAFSLERHPQPARLHAGDQLLDVLYRRRGLARGLTAAEEVECGAQL